jgi:hypothetical protein
LLATDEEHIGNFWKILELVDFVPVLDTVVADVERMEFDTGLEAIEFFDEIIAEPEFL